MVQQQTKERTNQDVTVSQQVIYQILGFDRPNFVSDVTNAVPQKKSCRITGMTFEGDGVQVNGQLIVEVVDQQLVSHIEQQLQSVRGLVSIKQTKKIRPESSESIRRLNPYARTFFLIWGVIVLAVIGQRTNASADKSSAQTHQPETPLQSQVTNIHFVQNYNLK